MVLQQLRVFLASIDTEYYNLAEECLAAGFATPAELAVATEDELTKQNIRIGAARLIIQQATQLVHGETDWVATWVSYSAWPAAGKQHELSLIVIPC